MVEKQYTKIEAWEEKYGESFPGLVGQHFIVATEVDPETVTVVLAVAGDEEEETEPCNRCMGRHPKQKNKISNKAYVFR